VSSNRASTGLPTIFAHAAGIEECGIPIERVLDRIVFDAHR